jgi:hypothetical protein
MNVLLLLLLLLLHKYCINAAAARIYKCLHAAAAVASPQA